MLSQCHSSPWNSVPHCQQNANLNLSAYHISSRSTWPSVGIKNSEFNWWIALAVSDPIESCWNLTHFKQPVLQLFLLSPTQPSCHPVAPSPFLGCPWSLLTGTESASKRPAAKPLWSFLISPRSWNPAFNWFLEFCWVGSRVSVTSLIQTDVLVERDNQPTLLSTTLYCIISSKLQTRFQGLYND